MYESTAEDIVYFRQPPDKGDFSLPTETLKRDEVLAVFHESYGRFAQKIEKLLEQVKIDKKIIDKWQKGEELTPDEENQLKEISDPQIKKLLSDFYLLTTGRRLTLTNNKDTFDHKFYGKDGKEYHLSEGIPVEGLLSFMRQEIRDLREQLKNEKDENRKAELREKINNIRKDGYIIYRSSKLISRKYRVARGRDAVEGTPAHARVLAEAKYISEDPLRNTGDDRENFITAIATVQNRRQLNLPIEVDEDLQQVRDSNNQNGIPADVIPRDIDAKIQPEEEEESPPVEDQGQKTQTEEQQETSSSSSSLDQIRYEFFIVNRSVDVRKRAAEMAEAQLRYEMGRGKWYNPKDFFRIFKLRLAEEYYRQKYKERALRAMLKYNNSYLDFDCVNNVVRDANQNRVGQEKAGKAIIEQMRQVGAVTGQEIREAKGELKKALIKEILIPIAYGEITNETQVREKLTAFVESHQDDPDVQALFGHDSSRYRNLADFFASDLMEMGEQTKRFIRDHAGALDLIDQQISIKLANATWGAQTEANFNAVDRFVAWCQGKRLNGAIFNPATLGAITGLAYSGIAYFSRVGLSRRLNLIAPGIGSFVGGTFAALRRWHDLQHDIASHRAEMAYGFEMVSGSKRREAIERFNYNTASIKDLIAGGGVELITGNQRKSIEELKRSLKENPNNEQLRLEIIQRIAEINSRLDLSVKKEIDLITAANSRDILREVGGLTVQESLDIGRAQLVLKVAEMRAALIQAGMSSKEIEDLENKAYQNWREQLLQNKEQQDRAIRNYKLTESFKAGVFGAGVGFASSLLAQEGIALVRRASGTPVGETNLEYILGKLKSLATGQPHIETPTLAMMKNLYHQGGSIELGDHLKMSVDSNTHQISIFDATGEARTDIPPITLDPQGHLDIAGQLPPDVQNAFNQMDFQIDFDHGPIILDSNASTQIDMTTGHQTVIPSGTEWVNDNGKWDLVVSLDRSKILIKGATFDNKGILVSYDQTKSLLDSNQIDFGKVDQILTEKFIESNSFIESKATGFMTKIPQGTHWVQDSVDPTKWDLVMDDDHSKVLLDDVVFDDNGLIKSFDESESLIKDPNFIDLGKITEGTSGKEIWENAGDYRVVHARSEVALPIRNSVLPNGQGVRFEFPDSAVYNPNTGVTEYLHDAAADNRLGILLQVPHYGPNGEDVAIFVPGQWDAEINKYVVDFDLNDTKTQITLPSGKIITMADLAKNFINQDKLHQFLPDSEMTYEGRSVFNLANPDGLIEHQGRILGGYLDPNSKSYGHSAYEGAFIAIHAVHGSSPVNLGSSSIIEYPKIKGILTTEVESKLIPPKIPPIEIRGVRLIPPAEPLPFPPIPWAPRWPLEKLEIRSIPYYQPYSVNSATPYQTTPYQTEEYYRSRMSSTILENPNAKLNAVEEINRYLNNQKPDIIESYIEINSHLPKVEDECQVFCCVPVYDLGEGNVILRALNQYLLQIDPQNPNSVDPKSFEIILFLNHPEYRREELEKALGHGYLEGSAERARRYLDDPLNNNVEPYDTEAVVREFMRRHPELRIRMFKSEFPIEPGQKPVWGEIIKPIYDLALLRSLQRRNPKDPLIVTNDADAVRLSPRYIADIIQVSEDYPEADGFVGRYDWAAEAYARNATFHVASRFESFISAIIRRERKRDEHGSFSGPQHTPGPNSIFRGSILAAIGGVNNLTDCGADGELGKIIYLARGKRNTIKYIHKLYTDMDPRRAIEAFEKGIPLIGTWSSWGDFSFYGKDPDKVLKSLTSSRQVDLERLQQEINLYIEGYGLNASSSEVKRILSWLGFKEGDYIINNNKIEIKSVKNVQDLVDRYIGDEVFKFHAKKQPSKYQ